MRHSIARELYEHKYQSGLSQDQYLSYLKTGLTLLKENDPAREYDPIEVRAIDIARDYNMEVMLSGVGTYDTVNPAAQYCNSY